MRLASKASWVFLVVWKMVSSVDSWAQSSIWHLLKIILTQFSKNIKYLVSNKWVSLQAFLVIIMLASYETSHPRTCFYDPSEVPFLLRTFSSCMAVLTE